MTRKVAPQLRQRVIRLLQDGLHSRKIAQELGISKTTVNTLRKEVDIPVPPLSPRFNNKLSEHAERSLVLLFKRDKVRTAPEAAKIFNSDSPVKISAQTVRRALKKAGMKAKERTEKPLLSSEHSKTRFKWCLERQE